MIPAAPRRSSKRRTQVKDVQFTVTLAEANLIIEGLGALPFARVHQLVAKLLKQAKRPSEAKPEPAPEAEQAQAAE